MSNICHCSVLRSTALCLWAGTFFWGIVLKALHVFHGQIISVS